MRIFDQVGRLRALCGRIRLSNAAGLFLLSLSAGCGEEAPAAPPEAPDILVIMIDALRPDHLGCYGYGRDTSPFLDRWAEGALRHEGALTHGTHTRIAVASLFTGTPPTVHRVRRVGLKPRTDAKEGRVTDCLARTLTTWGESLSGAGYETWGFSANPHIASAFGFAQGFTLWRQTDNHDGAEMVDAFLERWEDRGGASPKKPLFVYLHLMDVHNPYNPPPPWVEYFPSPPGRVVYKNGPARVSPKDLAYTQAQYDAQIRYVDTLLEKLIPAWEGGGPRSRCTVVLSDHGDEFTEHGGLGHGRTVYGELERAALLVRAPGVEPGVSTTPLGLTEVHALVHDLAGVALPDGARESPSTDAADGKIHHAESCNGWIGYRHGGRKLIFQRDDPGSAVWYDLSEDPGEQNPRKDPEVLKDLKDRLKAWMAAGSALADRLGTPEQVALDEDDLEIFRELGYVDGK